VLPELERFFRFWESQKALLDALRLSGITGILLERTIGAVSQTAAVKRIPGCDNEFAQTQIIRFAVSGIMIMMINWHHDGYRESPREMAELTARIIDQPLLPYLKEL
jgi:hypothetical protein